MSEFACGMALAALLSFPLLGWGHGLLLGPRATVAYYYPAAVQYVPVVAYPAYAVCVPAPPPLYPAAPQPSVPAPTYAPPTAAPPSAGPTTSEPPLAVPPAPAKPSAAPPTLPGFGESTSFYDAYSVISQSAARPAGERVSVDFWNLTSGDLVLRIEGGPPQILPRGRRLPVAVGRQFTWQVEGRQTQTSRVESGEPGLQIVIRR